MLAELGMGAPKFPDFRGPWAPSSLAEAGRRYSAIWLDELDSKREPGTCRGRRRRRKLRRAWCRGPAQLAQQHYLVLQVQGRVHACVGKGFALQVKSVSEPPWASVS